jgi:hypothetical protein
MIIDHNMGLTEPSLHYMILFIKSIHMDEKPLLIDKYKMTTSLYNHIIELVETSILDKGCVDYSEYYFFVSTSPLGEKLVQHIRTAKQWIINNTTIRGIYF